jgi:uncharacterized protein YfdQ (DUF2303 family)
MRAQIANFSQKNLQDTLELFIDAENRMKHSAVMQLPLELAILDVTHTES